MTWRSWWLSSEVMQASSSGGSSQQQEKGPAGAGAALDPGEARPEGSAERRKAWEARPTLDELAAVIDEDADHPQQQQQQQLTGNAVRAAV